MAQDDAVSPLLEKWGEGLREIQTAEATENMIGGWNRGRGRV